MITRTACFRTANGSEPGKSGLGEHSSLSLEDLVEHFDQKINSVLKDLNENTSSMAPVKLRSQDEIMSESQVWWTLTGNYGNILPLDFNKTQVRRQEVRALGLDEEGRGPGAAADDEGAPSSAADSADEEEEVRQALDLHQVMPEHVQLQGEQPPLSADQVIEEIDEMMQVGAACSASHS